MNVLGVLSGRVREVDIPVATSTASTPSTILGFADVTGLTVPVVAGGVYAIVARGTYQTSVATTGIGLRLAGTAVAAALRAELVIWGVTATTATQLVQTALGAANTPTTGVAVAATSYPWAIDGLIRVTTAGTLTVQSSTEVAVTTATVDANAYLRVERIA